MWMSCLFVVDRMHPPSSPLHLLCWSLYFSGYRIEPSPIATCVSASAFIPTSLAIYPSHTVSRTHVGAVRHEGILYWKFVSPHEWSGAIIYTNTNGAIQVVEFAPSSCGSLPKWHFPNLVLHISWTCNKCQLPIQANVVECFADDHIRLGKRSKHTVGNNNNLHKNTLTVRTYSC